MSTFLDEMAAASEALRIYEFNVGLFTSGLCMDDGLANITGLIITFNSIKSTAESLKDDPLNEALRGNLGDYISVANTLINNPGDSCRVERAVELFNRDYAFLLERIGNASGFADAVVQLAQSVADGLAEIKATDSWIDQRQEFVDLIIQFSDLSGVIDQAVSDVNNIYTATVLLTLSSVTARYDLFIAATEPEQMTALLNDIIAMAEIGSDGSRDMALAWDLALSTARDMEQVFESAKATPFAEVAAQGQVNGFMESGIFLAQRLIEIIDLTVSVAGPSVALIDSTVDNLEGNPELNSISLTLSFMSDLIEIK